VHEDLPQAEFLVPAEHQAGVYANAATVWKTPYDFTIDFAAFAGNPDDVDDVTARVVARVRIPTGFAFDLIRMVHATMARYEDEWGEIRRPERRHRSDE
jgi:hypothetical protein